MILVFNSHNNLLFFSKSEFSELPLIFLLIKLVLILVIIFGFFSLFELLSSILKVFISNLFLNSIRFSCFLSLFLFVKYFSTYLLLITSVTSKLNKNGDNNVFFLYPFFLNIS